MGLLQLEMHTPTLPDARRQKVKMRLMVKDAEPKYLQNPRSMQS